jgi:hypothetical protein
MKRCNLHIMPLNRQGDFAWNQPAGIEVYKNENGA